MTEQARQAIDQIVLSTKDLPGALMPMLHAIQEAQGYIPAQSVEHIARALNLSRAEVHGVVTYYHYFRSEPAGAHVVQICRAESCQAMGAEALWAHACRRLGREGGGTTADGEFTLEPVYCLGLCASSPALTFDAQPYARMDVKKFNRLIGGTGPTQ